MFSVRCSVFSGCAAAVIWAVAAVAGPEHPYGDAKFVPTPERPIGWRADGSGVFPGANPVLEWDDPTVLSPVLKASADVDAEFKEEEEESDAVAVKKPAKPGDLGRNIIWKVKMPDMGHGAPIAFGGRVYVTCDKDRLMCFSAKDGSVIWQDYPHLDDRQSNWSGSLGRSMPTPCSDGKHIYTKCTTGALICYDLNGTKKWSFKLENNNTESAIPSPTLVDGKVVVKERLGGRVIAIDAATGKSVWTVDVAKRRKANERLASNFDGYAVMRLSKRTLLIDSAGHALDAETGAVLARGLGKHGARLDAGNGMMNCSIPGRGDVNIFARMWRWGGFKDGHTAAYLNGSTRLYAYRFIEAGGRIQAKQIWENNRDFWGTARGATIVGDLCFWVSKNMDEMTVISMKTGDSRTFPWIFGIWSHTNVYGGNPYGWIYPHSVSDGWFLYHQGGTGLMAIVMLGPVPRLVAINKTAKGIGGPALHGDRMYIHSRDHMYCIGDLEAEKTGPDFEKAEQLAAQGKDDAALAVLGKLAGHPARHVQCRAVREMLTRHKAASIKQVAAALTDAHEWAHWMAIEAARRLKDVELAEAVGAVAPSAKPHVRATLLHMLAIRGESGAADVVLANLVDNADVVREAALTAARAVGAANVAVAIISRYAAAEKWERELMFAALAAMPGDEVSAAIAGALQSESAVLRGDAAELLGDRGAKAHKQALLSLSKDSSAVVRTSAARALRGLVEDSDLDILVSWMIAVGDRNEEEELVGVAGQLLRTHSGDGAAIGVIKAKWAAAKEPRKRCLLVRVLGKSHSTASLAVLKELLASGVGEDVAAAIGAELAAWSSVAARPILADMLKKGNPPRARYVGYMGYARSVELYEKDVDKRLGLLSKALPLAPRADDRRFVFEACTRLPDPKSLVMVAESMTREFGGKHAVAAVTRLAPVTLEKDYRKTMASVEEAMSAVELSRSVTSEVRKAQQAQLKTCMDKLEAIAAAKKLIPIGAEEDDEEEDELGLDL
ncbi:PQQ-binding-like beta-propeller repeat protein [Verrucomicrobiota bacterium]